MGGSAENQVAGSSSEEVGVTQAPTQDRIDGPGPIQAPPKIEGPYEDDVSLLGKASDTCRVSAIDGGESTSFVSVTLLSAVRTENGLQTIKSRIIVPIEIAQTLHVGGVVEIWLRNFHQ